MNGAFQLRPIIFRNAETYGKYTLTLLINQRKITMTNQPKNIYDGSPRTKINTEM